MMQSILTIVRINFKMQVKNDQKTFEEQPDTKGDQE